MSVIAIDGPAGAGKTTVATEVAHRLGWRHLDTGAMYRALALAVLDTGADPGNESEVAAVAAGLEIEITAGRTFLTGKDVTETIRDARVTDAVVQVSGHASARRALVELQRRTADHHHVVMEGRDIGTAVFPDAELKIYLTASLSERARRRWQESDGVTAAVEDLERQIGERDSADSSRLVSPLRRADDAIEIDSSELAIEEVVALIVGAARERGLLGAGG